MNRRLNIQATIDPIIEGLSYKAILWDDEGHRVELTVEAKDEASAFQNALRAFEKEYAS